MEEAPPGSAGIPPACTFVRCHSVSLRCGTRPHCRRERDGLGRSRVLAPLPVEPGGGNDQGCGKTCAGGTPALPGRLHPLTSSHGPEPSRALSASAFACGAALWRRDCPPPHQPSPAARLLRLPLKGGVLEASTRLPVELYHSPLEGESARPTRRPESEARSRTGGGPVSQVRKRPLFLPV